MRLRGLWKWITTFAAGLLLLVCALLWLAQSSAGRRFAASWIRQQILRQGVDASFELDYSLLNETIVLRDVKLAAPGKPPLITCSSVRFRLGRAELLKGRIRLTEVVTSELKANLEIDANGNSNIPQLPSSPDVAPSSLQWRVVEANAPRGSFRLRDARTGVALDLPSFNIAVNGPDWRRHHLTLESAQPGRVAWPGHTHLIEKIEAAALWHESDWTIERLQLSGGGIHLNAQGTLGSKSVNLQAAAQMPVALAAAWLQRPERPTGAATIRLEAQGDLAAPRITASLETTNIEIAGLPAARLQAAAEWQAPQRQVALKQATLFTAGGSLQARGELALDERQPNRLETTITAVDLSALLRPVAPAIVPAARAAGTATVRWTGFAFAAATATAAINLTPTTDQATNGALPVAASLTAEFSPAQIKCSIPQFITAGAELNGELTVDANRQLLGQIQLRAPDARRSVEQILVALGRPPGKEIPEGELDANLHFTGPLTAPLVTWEASAVDLHVDRLRNLALTANGELDARELRIANASLEWQGQQITATGRLAFARDLPLNLQATFDQWSLTTTLAALSSGAPPPPLKGTVRGQAQVSGSVSLPVVSASLSASNLEAWREPLGDAAIDLTVQSGSIWLDRFHLQRANDTLDASGQYDPATGHYETKVRMTEWPLLGLEIAGERITGRLTAQAAGDGSLEILGGQARLNGIDINVGGRSIGGLALLLELDRRDAILRLEAPRQQLTAEGRINVEPPYASKVRVKANNTSLNSLPVSLPAEWTGSVLAELVWQGSLENWRQDGAARLSLAGAQIQIRDRTVQLDRPAAISLAHGLLEVPEPMRLSGSAGMQLELSGSLPVQPNPPSSDRALRLRASVPVSSLWRLLNAGEAETAGEVNLDAQLRGSIQQPSAEAGLTLRQGSLRTPEMLAPLSQAQATIQLREGRLTVSEASAGWGPAQLQASADIPLALFSAAPAWLSPAHGPARARFEARGFDAIAWREGPAATHLRGNVSAEVSADRADWDALRGAIRFDKLEAGAGQVVLNQKEPVEARITGRRIELPNLRLEGADSRLDFSANATLDEKPSFSAELDAQLNAGLVGYFIDGVQTSGDLSSKLALKHENEATSASGFIEWRQGLFQMPAYGIVADQLDLRIELQQREILLTRLKGNLNSGQLTGQGYLNARDKALRAGFDFSVRGAYLGLGDGIKALADADINLRDVDRQLVLGGKVSILDSSITEPLTIEGRILQYLRAPAAPALASSEPNPFLQGLTYNVQIQSKEPVLIDNNLARLSADVDVRLVGRSDRPSLTGRVVLEEGGRLYLGQQTYNVERGLISLLNDQRIEPLLDVSAQTKAGGYDITVQITGDIKSIRTKFSSSPPLSEQDIYAVLLTGRTLEEARGHSSNIAREQAITYLASSLSGTLTYNLRRTIGLSQVRIDPNLIASEQNPGARLTLGKDITRKFSVIYSMNLTNSSDQIWITEWTLARRLLARGVVQNDQTYRAEIRHDVRFGGTSPWAGAERSVKRRFGQVEATPNAYFTAEQLRRKLGVKTGREYDFFKVRNGLARIEAMHRKLNLLEAKASLERVIDANRVNLKIAAEPGDQVEIVYEGWDVPSGVRKRVVSVWASGIFDRQRLTDAEALIRSAAIRAGYTQATVQGVINQPGAGGESTPPAAARKRVLFEIQPGVRYSGVQVVFPGAKILKESDLRAWLGDQRLGESVFTQPDRFAAALQAHYQMQGFLDAKVGRPRLDLNPETRTGQAIIPIEEGIRYMVGEFYFEGNKAYSYNELWEAVPFYSEEPYDPLLRQKSIDAVRELYAAKGYGDAVVRCDIERNPARPGVLDIRFRIEEMRQSWVSSIAVNGVQRINEKMVRSQLYFEEGDYLSPNRLARSRRALYQTDGFNLVDIEQVEAPDAKPPEGRRAFDIVVTVREVQPFEIKYGMLYDSDRGPGFIADLANRNSLGGARIVGLRTRYDGQIGEARGYFSQPLLRQFPIRTVVSTFARRDYNNPTFLTDRVGVSVETESQWRDKYVLSTGYRLQFFRVYERQLDPDFPFDIRFRVAPLVATFTRDTRDNLLDASKGSFLSNAFETGFRAFGSDFRYTRYFGQFFYYKSFGPPRIVPFEGHRRPRFVYASALRAGLASGLEGQILPSALRFFAGGGTTVRGFEHNALGPRDFNGDPAGGNAMLVLNQEFRFPLIAFLDGVGFYDAGNVFERLKDMRFGDLRHSAGFGLRVRNPLLLIRLDYGFVIGRQPNERIGRFFFSVGQTF